MKNRIIIFIILCITTSVFGALYAQEIVVKGKVLDQQDEVVIGATLFLKDRPGVGAATDIDGKFSLKASYGDIMVVSFVGYDRKEVLLTESKDDLVVRLKETSEVLEDVIVTGMGAKQRKISVVGAITNVDADQLRTPGASISNMLGGRVPGVITQQYSGEPGKNVSEFWIRGIGTFGANNSALVLVDGIEGDLNSLDPADIESFSILKDASATAVYGVRGANGVILVTTKRGTTDKLNVTARANFTLSHLTRMPDYLGAYDYAKLANEAKEVRGDLPLYDEMALYAIRYQLDPDLYPDVDWRKETLNNTSFQHTYYVSARGGGSLARYFLSLGMSDESAAYKTDKKSKYNKGLGYNTYNYRANLDMDLTKTTNIYFGVDGWFSKKTDPGNSWNDATDAIWNAQALLTPLTIPTRYSTGHLPSYGADDSYSPYVMLNHTGKKQTEKHNNHITLAINQDLSFITEGLSIRAQGAMTKFTDYQEMKSVLPEMYYASGRYVTGELMLVKKHEQKNAEFRNWQNQYTKYHFETSLNYEKLFAQKHRVSGLLYYYMSSEKNIADIGGDNPSMAAIPKRYQGLSGRVTYGYKDTYLLDLNFGYTGSENFKPGKQFGFFPSIALGWIPTHYDLMQEKLPWLNFLKFRGSYGIVGNDRISDGRFPYLTLVNTGAPTGWTSGSYESSIGGGITESVVGADNLKWEKAKKFNVGFETKLFNEKIDLVLDYFVDKRDGIFQRRTQVPEYVGLVNLPFGNVGEMKSWGADGNIAFNHRINEEMSFVVRGNFTYSTNEISNWEQPDPKYPYQSFSGWPYQIHRGLIALGLFKDQEDIDNSPIQTFGKYMPGDIKYKDVNGDGRIDSDDQVPLAYSNYPRLMFGFGGEFNYKSWTFNILFKGIGKKDFYYTGEGGAGYYPFLWGETGNVLKIVGDTKNRWIPASYSGDSSTENPNARFPRLSYGQNSNNVRTSTFWKANGQYIRLQEVSINYNMRNKSLAKIGISSIDLQLVGNDLCVWDKIGGLWDPEQTSRNGRAYPIPARYAFQMYINF